MMERRRALAIAAAVTATTVGAIAAITANFGLLGAGASVPLGKLDAGSVTEVPATGDVRYEDVYLPAPPTPAASPRPEDADVPATPTPTTSGYGAEPEDRQTDVQDHGTDVVDNQTVVEDHETDVEDHETDVEDHETDGEGPQVEDHEDDD